MRHLAVFALLAVGVALALVQGSDAATLVVGPGGYATIQAAVNAASPGDTISIHAGTYAETVGIAKDNLTLLDFGDGKVTITGSCQRDYGVYLVASGVVLHGNITIDNTRGASVFIDGTGSTKPHSDSIDGLTMTNFDCAYNGQDPSSYGQFRGAVADWYGGAGIKITSNTMIYRPAATSHTGQVGSTDVIWFKSNDNNPSGGGHYIAGNTIIGGWDGIGGEEEGSAHGTFDRDTTIQANTIRDTWDDCIQVEGGDANVQVRGNDLSGCGTGIAFAAPMSGPLYINDNRIHDLVTGLYDNHVCYKVGTNGSSSALTYLTGNTCDVRGGSEANGIHQSGGDNMTPIIARGNSYSIGGYAFYVADTRGQDYQCDIFLFKGTQTDNFDKWGGIYDSTLAAFQARTGQETSSSCGVSPTPTSTPPAPNPSPVPTGTVAPTVPPTPSTTPTPVPPTATPTRTPTPVVTPTKTPTPITCQVRVRQFINGRWVEKWVNKAPEFCQ